MVYSPHFLSAPHLPHQSSPHPPPLLPDPPRCKQASPFCSSPLCSAAPDPPSLLLRDPSAVSFSRNPVSSLLSALAGGGRGGVTEKLSQLSPLHSKNTSNNLPHKTVSWCKCKSDCRGVYTAQTFTEPFLFSALPLL